MYKISTRTNAVWGVEGYEVPRQYIDPAKQILDRNFLTQKKGQKNTKYVTKRGHYLNDLIKQHDKDPAPNAYKIEHKWVDPNQAKKIKIPAPKDKNTYIDVIYREGTKNKNKPGPGSYNLRQTDDQIKKALELTKSKKIK